MRRMNSCRGYHLAAAGDVFLRTRSGVGPFNTEVLKVFNRAEVGLVNLETPVTDHNYCEEKAVSLRVAPQQVRWLRDVGENIVVNLANNHMLDCGLVGLQDTIKYLQSSEMGCVGVVENFTSQKPYSVQLSCGKLAILGYTVGGEIACGIGVAKLDEFQVVGDIVRAKENGADWIVVNLHWGLEYASFPSPSQQHMARLFVDAGANVIVGSHSHVVQGIERYKNGIIFYSLGNFNFHTHFDEGNPYTDWGIIALIHLDHKRVEYEVVPVKINSDYQPELMSNTEQMQFYGYLTEISAHLSSGISPIFWLSHASAPYFRSNFRGFRARIRHYGLAHCMAMIKWLVHPCTYPYYLGLLLKAGKFVDVEK